MASLTQYGGVIHADAIKQAIESNEDIFLDKKVEIQGDLDLTPQLDISPRENLFNAIKLVNSKIFISNCIFRGSLKLTNCRFCEDVCFSGSHFDEYVSFWPGNYFLNRAEFLKGADFSHTIFKKGADFHSTRFHDEVTFKEAVFYRLKDRNAIIDFGDVDFKGPVDFQYSKFYTQEDSKEIDGSNLKIEARFLNAQFYKTADFSGSTFKHLQFDDARFCEKASFDYCVFEEDARFKSASFEREASFKSSTFNKKFLLNGANFYRLIVRWNDIKNKLGYEEYLRARTESEEKAAGSLKDYHEIKRLEYDALFRDTIKNFRDIGQYDDADSCYLYLKRLKKAKLRSSPLLWLEENISWHFFGHGIDYRRPVYSSVAVLFTSFLIFLIYYAMNEVGSIQNMRFLCLDQSWTSLTKAAYSCLISFISTSQIDNNAFNIVKRRRRTPLQADGASKAPPHESGTR